MTAHEVKKHSREIGVGGLEVDPNHNDTSI